MFRKHFVTRKYEDLLVLGTTRGVVERVIVEFDVPDTWGCIEGFVDDFRVGVNETLFGCCVGAYERCEIVW
jgi:hypothetical protein